MDQYTPINMHNLQITNLQIHNSITAPGGSGTASSPGTAGPYSPSGQGGAFYFYSGSTGINQKTLSYSDGTNWFSIFKSDSSNTANTNVLRDASGNFNAGTITAALSGNATTATTLQTSQNFSITGKATAAAVAFNGSGAVALNITSLSVVPGEITLTTGYLIYGVGGVGAATAPSSIAISSFGAATSDINMNSRWITNLSDPVNPQDAATKAYVDATKQGLDPKDSCKLATTTALASSYSSGTQRITMSAVGALSFDGVTPSVGDRILVKDQTGLNQPQNGIYTVITVGDAYTAGVLQRAADFNTSAKAAPGSFTFIEQGSTQSDTGWVMTADSPITLDSTNITWVQFSSAGIILAGNGLVKVGNTLHFISATYNTGDLPYASGTTTMAMLAAAASGNVLKSGTTPSWGKVALGTDTSGTLGVTQGGTNATTVTTNGVAYGGSGGYAFTAAMTAGQIILANATNVPTPTSVTGDVTISSSGVTAIGANKVLYSMLQQVAASSLVGNPTGSLANAQGITLGATLSFSGTALQTAAHTGDVTTAANSFATTIANNAVTYAKFQQVAASSLVGNPTGALANAQGITLGATLTFSGTAIQTAAHTGDVTTTANSFATTIAANAVTHAKFQQIAALSVVGNATSATANTSAIAGTADQVLRVNSAGNALAFGAVNLAAAAAVTGTLPSGNGGLGFATSTAGDLIYASATNTIGKLGIGTANQVLTSSGAAPQWSSALTLTGLTITAGTVTVSATPHQITQTWNGSLITTTGASGTGTVATLTFAAQPAAFPVGSTIVVSGVTPSGYNGTYTVTASSTTSVSFNSSATGAQTVAGTVQQLFVLDDANVTDTASAVGSYLIRRQVGGTVKFGVLKDGSLVTASSALVSNLQAQYAANIYGGAAGGLPYQTAANTTSLLSIGASGSILSSTGSAPQWITQSSMSVGSATTATTSTNLAGGAAGGLPYQTGSGATSILAPGVSNQVLTSGGSGAPVWVNPGALTVGTAINIGGGTIGALPWQSASGTTSMLSIGAANTVLTSTGSAPSWAQVNLTSMVTGILPSANGGTGSAYFAISGPTALRTYSLKDANSNLAVQLSGTFTGDGVTTVFTATHNIGSKNVIPVLYDSNDNVVGLDMKAATTTTVTYTFTNAPANASTWRWVVVGF